MPAAVDPSASLGDLVAERPARAGIFERLRLDYCCGGAQSLAEACGRRGLDVETVRQLLEALGEAPLAPALEDFDWRAAGVGDLCDHIVAVHHEGLRRDLPRIAELLATVVRVHGGGHPELRDLQRLFTGAREELEHHLELEERVLFPACRAAGAGAAAADVDQGLIVQLEHDHDAAGDAFAAMGELTGGFDASRALCGTHRRLLDALRRLELDLHQHVHEENNVLFPRVRRLVA